MLKTFLQIWTLAWHQSGHSNRYLNHRPECRYVLVFALMENKAEVSKTKRFEENQLLLMSMVSQAELALKASFHCQYLLAKLSVTATCDSHYCTCLGHLGWHNTDRIISIFCCTIRGGQGKYKCVAHRPIYRSVVLLLHVIVAGIIAPTFADVNTV